MRRRVIFPALVVVLIGGASAGGCQILAGLTPLEITGGTDGGVDGGTGCAGAEPGTPCGGTCTGSTFTPAGTCDDQGRCSAQPAPCPMSFACNAAGTACNTSCATSDDCDEQTFCAPGPHACLDCGAKPPNGQCAATCESCDSGTCVTTCDTPGECASDQMFDTKETAVRIECKDQCHGITLSCGGPHPCEVVCEQGGCTDLVFRCSADGPCKLTCHGGSCFGAHLECGGNTCEAVCDGGMFVDQSCNGACSCTKSQCM